MSNEDTAQYREFIFSLMREEHRPTALNDLKNFFTNRSAGEAVITMRDVGISKIIQCVNVPDKNQLDLTCEVLKACFEKFDIGEVVKNYTSNIMYLLRHDKPCVRRLAVDEVYKVVATDPNLLPMPLYIDVYVAVAQLVKDSDLGVANKAVLISSNLPHQVYSKVLEEMKIALEYNSSSKCNAYEIIINISTKSCELFKICTDLGYIDFMVSELEINDILYQLNILELLSRLAVKTYGINYLVESKALDKIAERIVDLKHNPLGSLLIPGYMKFFGCIAHHYPKNIFDKYPVLLDLLFDGFVCEDQNILLVSLDTLGFIGSTIEGKLCLAAIGARFNQSLEKAGEIARNSPTEIKIRALHCFASLISIENDPNTPRKGPVDHRVTLLTREWFRSMSKHPSSIYELYGICKNPFPEIKLAALTLLDAVCQHQWGFEMVGSIGGFLEYLLDRSVDYTKEAKEMKYDVIRRLANSVAFEPNLLIRLQEYVEQGPFYSETNLEVALEGED
ncbi:hypothetical protein K1T71_005509 [Dendrolimus kikuchii]|uniref:Uncharacterized protein n=1 Tax=Dendrolimus kikuchii TaxID=765133 RepID=A0ACC1D4T2_9NEOP|nr:hypothetical protein K1T71_005509 [Dendrolimus kikuchii]